MKFIPSIASNIALFKRLVHERKIITNKMILLSEKNNNPRWIHGQSQAILKGVTDKISFTIKVSKVANKYGLMLGCKELCEPPYLRFDSDGATHVNSNEDIPLLERVVMTPHFNTYDEEGREFAYKNAILKDEAEATAIANSLEFGISLFCNESNAFLEDNEVPTYVDTTTLPFLEIEQEFIQNNIKFE